MAIAARRIDVIPFLGRVTVESLDGRVLADTRRALALHEASYAVVYYVPRADAAMDLLERTTRTTHCPYKGDASYFTITGQPNGVNAVWSYEHPLDDVAIIREHLAFYPDRVRMRVEPESA